jgi:hypothetical protein
MHVKGRARWVVRAILIVPVVIAVLALVGWVVMLLWNALVPQLFHGPALGYWQAVGLLLLSRLLFGGLRGRGGWRGHWRHRWRERWEQMTPEERAQLREKIGSRCGHGGGPAASASPP